MFWAQSSLQKQFKNLVVRPKFAFPLSLSNGDKATILQKETKCVISQGTVGPGVPRGSAGSRALVAGRALREEQCGLRESPVSGKVAVMAEGGNFPSPYSFQLGTHHHSAS